MKKDRKSGTSDEDRALWDHVTRSVRAYEKRPRRSVESKARQQGTEQKEPRKIPPATGSNKPKPPAAKKSAGIATPQKSTLHVGAAAKPSGKTIGGAASGPLADDGTAQSLRRKKWPLEKTLDLHGMTQTAAHQALLRFVALADRQDKRTLLVITGKGSRLAGGGVLRRMLPMWLEEPPLRAKVLACTPARSEDGGDGAFYIRLRKKKQEK